MSADRARVATRVAVVVVGDLARSPRMRNHANELAAAGRRVSLIGLREREFHPPAGVEVEALRAWRGLGALGLAGAAVRMALTGAELFATLLRVRPDVILVQNPPSFPTLAVARAAAKLLRARFVVDWHNYGFSMLAMRPGVSQRLVRWFERHEARHAKAANAHLCVSEAMRADLARRFHLAASVLYDRPLRLLEHKPVAAFTVVCPAGWTADEDMQILFDAIALTPPRAIEFHITGDGPTRVAAEPGLAALRAAGHVIHASFLPAADYWALIARADLGISMHRSSSGLDLAMKVVDLFSAATPVCAFDYGGALGEQVCDHGTGFLFQDAGSLAAALHRALADRNALEAMRNRIRLQWNTCWREVWQRNMNEF